MPVLDPDVENRLSQVQKKIGNHEWANATELCQQALGLLDSSLDPFKTALFSQLQARCDFERAFHSNTRNDFELLLKNAGDQYYKTAALYEKTGLEALAKRLQAKGTFARFWLAHNPDERRRLVQECILLATTSLKIQETQGQRDQTGETYNDLLVYHAHAIHLDTEWNLLKENFERALEAGRSAIAEFERLDNSSSLLESLRVTIKLIALESQSSTDSSRTEVLAKEATQLQERLVRLSEKTGSARAARAVKEGAADIAFGLKGDYVKALGLFEEVASEATEIFNSPEIGELCWEMASVAEWRALAEEHSENRRELLEKGLAAASRAIKALEIPLQTSNLAMAYATEANCYIDLANYVETEVDKKRFCVEKAIESASKGTTFETGTLAWQLAAHALSKATYFLATITQDPARKNHLLNEALNIREETLRVTDQLLRNFSWSRGVMRNYLALIKAELAAIEKDSSEKTRLLREAGSHMQECIEFCSNSATNPSFKTYLAQYCESYGDILVDGFKTTAEAEQALRAVKAYQESIAYLSESGLSSPLGALNWKIARVFDSLGNLKAASDTFRKAAEEYGQAGRKFPAFGPTFADVATYMEAWAEIENARLAHAEEEYAKAHESYSRAAKALQRTHAWTYLSKLFIARSLLERGEAHSGDEKHETSILAFSDALTAFQEERVEIESKLRETIDAREEMELKNWLKITDQREGYARGRIELEEARAFDKKGQKGPSSRKYLSASGTFQALVAKIDSPSDRGEMEALALFCEAWAQMKKAESRASPEIYSQAAETFAKATESTSRETFRLLALANASICKALVWGTKFRLTRNIQLYSEIKKELETAADYYQESGFRKTASWTRATQRLFDALLYLANAEVEQDPKKKTEFYHFAEKHFELAAKLYGEAGFPAKKREALEHSGRAREEKKLLLAPIEDLSEIPKASGTIVTAPPLGRGQPQGLERFEDANVVGNLSVPKRELNVGTDLVFELEMANVGRTTATLIKLENVAPDGFEIELEKNPYRLVDGHIDMRGRRLEHLKMHEMKIVLKPTRRGEFELRPRVLFSDDKGNFRMHEFGPVQVEVQELGISGWLRGPGKKETGKPTEKESRPEEPTKPIALPLDIIVSPAHLPPEFQFETQKGRDVFQYLVRAFVDDYMSKRIYVEKSGWRTLMDLVRHTGASRSAFYGPGGRTGAVLAELERRGLVESRIFPEEPGRGGEITKVRVAYDNLVVRRIVEKAVMENT